MSKGKYTRWALGLWGAAGALAPDALLLYSKRFTMPDLTFSITQYAAATIIYLMLAALVASIFPYGRQKSEWKAFGVGASLPVIISGVAALGRDQTIVPRGEILSGTLLDLLSMF